MKQHPGLLAGGMIVFAIFACNTSNNRNANTNTNAGPTRSANAEVYVDSIHMAKDNSGEAGASTTTFSPDERTVHVVINLNKAKAGTQVKVVWIAADVEGAKDKELKTLDYTTTAFDKTIPGYLKWSQDWPRGSYKCDVYINGALDKSIAYTIE